MTEVDTQPLPRRVWKYLLPAAAAVVLVLGCAVWYLTTDSFQSMVRRRLVAELERITGGRVELGSLHVKPFLFQVEVRGLTVHGREGPNDVPYIHVDSLTAKVNFASALGGTIGFHSLVLERPVVHIVFYPEATNQPGPRVEPTGGRPTSLLATSVDRLEVRQGKLLWGDQAVPLDFAVDNVSANMSYSLLSRRYQGDLLIGKANTKFEEWRPLSWMAEAHFSVGSHDLELKSLKLNSGHSHLETSGKVTDFQRPQVDLSYKALLDLWEAASITRNAQVQRGTFEADGHVIGDAMTFSSAGKLTLKNFEGHNETLSLHDASLTSPYAISPERFTLSQIQAKLLGGTVAGEAELVNWRGSGFASSLDKGKAAKEQKGTIKLRFQGISAGDVASAVSSRTLPLNRLHLVGEGAGTNDLQWHGTIQDVEVRTTLDFVPPARTASGEIPLSAHVRAFYRRAADDLELADFFVKTRASEVHASGSLAANAALKFSVASGDLNEWRTLLWTVGYKKDVPANLRGTALFEGTATGRVSDPLIAGTLRVSDFDVLVPGIDGRPGQRFAWDSLTTYLEASRQHLVVHNAALRHGDASFKLDASVSLQQGQLSPRSAFSVRLDARNANPAKVVAFAGFEMPIVGDMDIYMRAWGTVGSPQGKGHVELHEAMVYGEEISRFGSDVHLANGQVDFTAMHFKWANAQVNGSFGYSQQNAAFHFDVAGTGLDLAEISQLQTKTVPVKGKADFTAHGAGPRGAPGISAHVQLRDLALGTGEIGAFAITATSQGDQLHLIGRSQSERTNLTADGDIQTRGDGQTDITLKFAQLDVDSLLGPYLAGRVKGHVTTTGLLRVKGPILRPRELDIYGELGDLGVGVESLKVANQGPIRFSVVGQTLKVDQFHLVGEGTDFSANGTVQLAGQNQIQMQADGQVNLRLLETLDPDFTSFGAIRVHANVAGTTSQPTMQGRMDITRGSIAYIDLPSALSEITGSIVFNQDRAEIEGLTAHVGGGSVTFKGQATFYNRQLHFDLGLLGQDVRLRYPPGVSSTANLDVRFVGTPEASTLSGDVTITKLSLTPGFDFGAYLQRSAQSVALPQTNPLLNRIHLDLHIVTTPELQMRTASVHLSGDADLHLRGTAAKPSLLGRADILEGEVYFNGTKYRLERGDVTFLPAGPVVDLQATTRVRDYDITLSVNGPADKLNMTYRSEPPLPSADIISLLALGRTRQESAQLQSSQSPFSGEATNAILNEALNAAVSNRVQRLFGGSRIKIDPEGLTTETSTLARGPSVTIEQQVAGNLTLTYTTNVSQASQQIIQAEYNISRNVSIVAVRDQNGVLSFDVRIRRRKK